MCKKPKAVNMISRYIKLPLGKASALRYPDADLGYRGIEQYHANRFIPVKRSKNHYLSQEEKAYTKELSGRRVVMEHINAKIKTWRCMAYPYRGHCGNRHSLRITLICGLINYDRLVGLDGFLNKSIIFPKSLSGCFLLLPTPDSRRPYKLTVYLL
jgi:hypothetical protein